MVVSESRMCRTFKIPDWYNYFCLSKCCRFPVNKHRCLNHDEFIQQENYFHILIEITSTTYNFFMKTHSAYSILFFALVMLAGCKKNGGGNPPVVNQPSVSGISPTSGPVNTVVTITGNNFGTDATKVAVSFNGTPATVQSVTNTEIKTLVLANTTTGNIKVTVNGQIINGPIFTVIAGSKTWWVKDISFPSLDCSSPTTRHRFFTYNAQGQIIRITDSVTCYISKFEIVYNTLGKITQINSSTGPFSPSHSTTTVHYNSTGEFVHSLVPEDSVHNSTVLYNWNLNSNNELDEVIRTGSPLIITVPFTTHLVYDYVSGGYHGSSFYNEHDNLIRVSDVVFSAGLGLSIPNPFHRVGMTPEQIFLYIYSGASSADVLLGSNLPNGIFEGYSYATGNKVTSSHSYHNYTVDGNNNVSKITLFYAQDSPNFSNFVNGGDIFITYEQH